MSEMRLPEQTEPPSPLPPAPKPASTGSLALGFVLAWAIVIVGNIALALFIGVASGLLSTGRFNFFLPGFFSVPELVAIGLAVWFIVKGRIRTGIGIFLGLASIVAVALLLVAACFGLFAGGFSH